MKFFWTDSEPRGTIRETDGALLRIGHHVDIYTEPTATTVPGQGFPSTMASVGLATFDFSPRCAMHHHRNINNDRRTQAR